LKTSLVLLLFANASFLAILAFFHRRCSMAGIFDADSNRAVKMLTFALYAVSVLILVRDIFRVVQIFSSSHSSAWTTEALFWVFDASPLLISSLLLNAFHPGKLVVAGVSVGQC
jgi:hypothetical protein